MVKARPTHLLEVTLDELRALRRRIDQDETLSSDRPLLGALVSQQIGQGERRDARMLAKVAATVAASSSTSEPPSDPKASDATAGSPASSSSADAKATSHDEAASPAAESDAAGEKPEPGDDSKSKGHGRNGASAFRAAQHFFHALALGVIGAICTACQLGKMSRYREKIIIRIVGQPMFRAEQHHHEQARCRNCGRVVRAEGPACVHEGVGTEYIRYDWSACAMLLFMHYSGGDPFKRVESHHAGWGVPMPDANQWEVVDKADDLLLPLYRALEQHAIQRATNFRIDDTGSVVITLKRQIEAELASLRALGESTKGVRTGINATGIYWETPDGPVVLYYTGRHHAGEIIDQVLGRRLASRPTLVKCTDGASKNFDHAHADKLVEATCNAHALLKFRDIKDKYPAEYAEAGKVYSAVFDNDDKAKALGLNPVDRMLYHRQHSKPLMLQLKKMCEEKVTSRSVEPSSPLWEPVTFILNQWERLTLFCEAPGVPLDTNLVEQALIVPARYLAGSFNYHTENGAVVGDHAMSLIATARAHGVEPVAYLTECLRSHEDLAKRPEHYLPWVYRQAATMYIEKELSKLNTLLSEVPAHADDLTVAEALKLVCNRSSEYGVSKEDIIQFYEVWGVERVPDFEASSDDWLKPDELAIQRRQLATAVAAVSGLTKSVADVAAEAAALRQLIGRAQQTQAEDRSAQKILGDAQRKLDETVAALAEEVRRGEGRLKALEDGSRNSVATSTLKSEVQRVEASTKAAITTATDAARAALADAFNAELSRAKAELERELQDLSSKLSEATASVAPFKGSSGYPSPFAGTPRSPGESIKDVAALRRALTSAARARGVDPSLMLQVHAAVAAGLTPVTLGPGALAALMAYAHGACGGRLLIIHVSPSAIQPRDLDEAPGGGLVAAVAAARDIDGLSLVVLEGANRSPIEGSVVPLLQLMSVGLSPLAPARGLRLSATLVAGATTVPVSSQLWSYATAIYPEPGSPGPQSAPSPGDLSLSSELLAPGNVPTDAIDALVESWPDCRELRPALARLGAALTRLYDKEEQRITEALLHGLVLPYVATALSAEEQAEALNTARDADGTLAKALRLLRRRLC